MHPRWGTGGTVITPLLSVVPILSVVLRPPRRLLQISFPASFPLFFLPLYLSLPPSLPPSSPSLPTSQPSLLSLPPQIHKLIAGLDFLEQHIIRQDAVIDGVQKQAMMVG